MNSKGKRKASKVSKVSVKIEVELDMNKSRSSINMSINTFNTLLRSRQRKGASKSRSMRGRLRESGRESTIGLRDERWTGSSRPRSRCRFIE